jgi:hypothetical protein
VLPRENQSNIVVPLGEPDHTSSDRVSWTGNVFSLRTLITSRSGATPSDSIRASAITSLSHSGAGVGVKVGVGVLVGTGVNVAVGVYVGVGVDVAVGVLVTVGVGV